MLRAVVGMLLFMCTAGSILILGRMRLVQFPGSEIVAFGVLVLTIVAGISTMQPGSFDVAKISELIKKVDAELLALNEARLKILNKK
jgi:branched-subunit amino acid ABC-type transport system permease component